MITALIGHLLAVRPATRTAKVDILGGRTGGLHPRWEGFKGEEMAGGYMTGGYSWCCQWTDCRVPGPRHTEKPGHCPGGQLLA